MLNVVFQSVVAPWFKGAECGVSGCDSLVEGCKSFIVMPWFKGVYSLFQNVIMPWFKDVNVVFQNVIAVV